MLQARDAFGGGKGIGKARGGKEGRERDDEFGPGLSRRQRHFDLGQNAVDAVGMQDLQNIAIVELDGARGFLDR